jgi:hypothetical protein
MKPIIKKGHYREAVTFFDSNNNYGLRYHNLYP